MSLHLYEYDVYNHLMCVCPLCSINSCLMATWSNHKVYVNSALALMSSSIIAIHYSYINMTYIIISVITLCPTRYNPLAKFLRAEVSNTRNSLYNKHVKIMTSQIDLFFSMVLQSPTDPSSSTG